MERGLKISVLCPACEMQMDAEEVEHVREEDVISVKGGCMVKTYMIHPEAHIHCSCCKRRLSIQIKAADGFVELRVSC